VEGGRREKVSRIEGGGRRRERDDTEGPFKDSGAARFIRGR
jgi:hypothetical protein